MSFSNISAAEMRSEGVRWPATHFMHPAWVKLASEAEFKKQVSIIQQVLRDPDINAEYRIYERSA